jgi:hypothetical protein
MSETNKREESALIEAAKHADWLQVTLNYMSSRTPPCFHLEGDRFCLRAQAWDGHDNGCIHAFMPLSELLANLRDEASRAAVGELTETEKA